MKPSSVLAYNFLLGCLVVAVVYGCVLHFQLDRQPHSGWSCHPSDNLIGYRYQNHPQAQLKSTGDPLVWGPTVWASLHMMAENYPKHANQPHQAACHRFLSSLPYMLPCGECGYHFRDYERAASQHNFQQECAGRDQLRRYLVEAHNQVNQKQQHPKPSWTVAEAEQHYSQMPAVIRNPEKWKSDQVL